MKIQTSVAQFMKTKKISLNPNESLLNVEHNFRFSNAENLIVEQNEFFIGVINKRDFEYQKDMMNLKEKSLQQRSLLLKNHTVNEIVAKRLIRVNPEDSMEMTISLFKSFLCRFVAVVKGDKLVGYITQNEVNNYRNAISPIQKSRIALSQY